jgi:hypothetical protein
MVAAMVVVAHGAGGAVVAHGGFGCSAAADRRGVRRRHEDGGPTGRADM